MTAASPTETRPVSGAPPLVLISIAASAFLLFVVQPLVGRLLLPVFGGGPMLWTAVLLFFQVVLLAGYGYAHVSMTWLGRWGPIAHLGLAAVALLLLVTAPATLLAGAARSAVDAVWALARFVGLPALVLSATTPLLSSWLGTIDPGSATRIYRLFGIASIGALVALVAYPILIEPRLGLGTQRFLWTIGFVGFAALMAWLILVALPGFASRAGSVLIGLGETMGRAPDVVSWSRRARWGLLACVPSGLLAALTTVLASDIGSLPLVWIAPLAVYLVSWIVAFGRPSGRLVRWAGVATPAAATLLWVTYGFGAAWPIVVILLLDLVAFLVIATGLHGQLVADRPDETHLTDYSLTFTTGGAIGAAFVAILAPTLFPDLWEYPILLVLALTALAVGEALPTRTVGMRFAPFLSGVAGRLVPYVVVAAALVTLLVLSASPALVAVGAWLAIGGLILLFGGRRWLMVFGTSLILVLSSVILQPAEFRGRSFMGVSRVIRSTDTGLTVLVSSMTVHGSQWTDPARSGSPTAYYGPGGPAEDLFEAGATQHDRGATEVGVVGLGAGELAAYADEFTVMTFFEIDPVVVRIAQDPELFTYLSEATGGPQIVVGDGRRSLAAEPDAEFDLLVLDGFTGGSVPVHLLTAEALADVLRTVRPDGVVAIHISNRYFDLAPPVAAAFQQLQLTTLERLGDGAAPGELASRWLATSQSQERLQALRALGWTPVDAADRPFTDDYTDLLSYLRLGF